MPNVFLEKNMHLIFLATPEERDLMKASSRARKHARPVRSNSFIGSICLISFIGYKKRDLMQACPFSEPLPYKPMKPIKLQIIRADRIDSGQVKW